MQSLVFKRGRIKFNLKENCEHEGEMVTEDNDAIPP